MGWLAAIAGGRATWALLERGEDRQRGRWSEDKGRLAAAPPRVELEAQEGVVSRGVSQNRSYKAFRDYSTTGEAPKLVRSPAIE